MAHHRADNCRPQHSRTVRRAIVTACAAVLVGGIVGGGYAAASPAPPTNGGNGAGMSGQCTGDPVDRPAVCPAAK